MIRSIAWKNVWRNKIRSIIVIAAATIGLLGGVFTSALMNGMMERRIRAAINNEISHIQIHNPLYLDNEEVTLVIKNADDIINKAKQMPEVEGACKRMKLTGMALTSNSGNGVMIMGVNPDQEKQVTELFKAIPDSNKVIDQFPEADPDFIQTYLTDSCGNYFDNEAYRIPPIIIGKKLAEKLKVKVRKKINIYAQTIYGEISKGNFRVIGIYETSNYMFDEMAVFVRTKDLATITGLEPDQAHEIAIKLTDAKFTDQVIDTLQDIYTKYKLNDLAIENLKNEKFDAELLSVLGKNKSDDPMSETEFASFLKSILSEKLTSQQMKTLKENCVANAEIMGWKDVQPDLGMMTDFLMTILYVFVIIILLGLGFGIVNTMLMVVLERVKELGMLMAVGMNKKRVFGMIMLESVFLSIVGGIFGMAISWLLIGYFSHNGLDLSIFADGFKSMGFEAVLYPYLGFDFYIGVTVLVILTGVLAAVYPALKALKLNPVEALRSE